MLNALVIQPVAVAATENNAHCNFVILIEYSKFSNRETCLSTVGQMYTKLGVIELNKINAIHDNVAFFYVLEC